MASEAAAPTATPATAAAFHIGATHARVSVYQDKDSRPESIAAECGHRLIRAYVSFAAKSKSITIGTAAQKLVKSHPTNTIHGLTHLVGLSFREIQAQNLAAQYPFTIVKGASKRQPAKISVQYAGKTVLFTVTEILAMLLNYLKVTAENALEGPITTTVIVVPSYMSGKQRDAVRQAAQHARCGLTQVQVISDNTATLVGASLDRANKFTRKAIVVNVGGTSSCATLFEIAKGMLRPLCTTGKIAFGGDSLDDVLMAHYEVEAAKRMPDVRKDGLNAKAKFKLREAIQTAKGNLTKGESATVQAEALSSGMDLVQQLSRGKFESLVSGAIAEGLCGPIRAMLDQASPDWQNFQLSLFAGSGAQVPKVQAMVLEALATYNTGKKKSLNLTTQTDEAAIKGGCLQAHYINLHMEDAKNHEGVGVAIRGKTMALPCDLGVRLQGGDIEWVLRKGAKFPVTTLIPCDLAAEDEEATSHVFEVVRGPISEITEASQDEAAAKAAEREDSEETAEDEEDEEGDDENEEGDDESEEEGDDEPEDVTVLYSVPTEGANKWLRVVPTMDATMALSATVWDANTGTLAFTFKLPSSGPASA